MEVFKILRTGFKALLFFSSITVVFSLPALVRCHGEVDSQARDGGHGSVVVVR
jgi:hypothetical protein